MSNRSIIIRARAPAPRTPQPQQARLPVSAVEPAAAPDHAAFQALVASWQLDSATAEALLAEPVRLTPMQQERVRLLMQMDTAAPAPEWFTWPNAHPNMAGDAPADQMARMGLPAFRRVLRVLGCE